MRIPGWIFPSPEAGMRRRAGSLRCAKRKYEGFLRLGKPLSKGHRTFSKPDSLLHTRPVLNASPVSSILDVRVLFSPVHLHSTFPFPICRISIPDPFDSSCTAIGLLTGSTSSHPPFICFLSRFANGAAGGTRTRTSRRRRHADACLAITQATSRVLRTGRVELPRSRLHCQL